MKFKVFLSIIALLATGASTNAERLESECLRPTAAPRISVSDASGGVVENVLCCCATYNGQCCKYVGFCGAFIPGCFCSGNKPEPMGANPQP